MASVNPLPPVVALLGEHGEATSEWQGIAATLGAALKEGRLALLAGSGISQFAPSNAPYAQVVSQRVQEMLREQLPRDVARRFKASASAVPFEVLMARLNEIDSRLAQEVTADLTQVTAPNLVHLQIARLLAAAAEHGTCCTTITTNYDTGIELGIEQLRDADEWPHGCQLPRVVVAATDVDQADPRMELFHIHGCTTALDSLVLDYNQEFRLGRWKRAHIKDLLEGKVLLVMGFSGWDLDISRALRNASPAAVVWLRRNQGECIEASWSIDAREALRPTKRRVQSAVQIDTSGRLGYVIPTILGTAPADPEPLDLDAGQARYAAVRQRCGEDGLGLWARWTGLRAGFAELADAVPDAEEDRLRRSQRLEIEAFGHFYAGRHRTGARFQALAAMAAIEQGEPLDRYIYYRNNEVEYLNRGGFTLRALGTLLAAVITLPRLMVDGRHELSDEARGELRNLLACLALLWPLPPLYVLALRWHAVVKPVLGVAAGLVLGADVDKHATIWAAAAGPGSEEFAQASARYEWLGQKARVINLYRITAFQALRRGLREDRLDLVHQAHALSDESALWAACVQDPCRFGKSWLAVQEVMAACGQEEGLAEAAAVGWAMLREGEISPWVRLPAELLYRFGCRKGRAKRRAVRRFALSFLETS